MEKNQALAQMSKIQRANLIQQLDDTKEAYVVQNKIRIKDLLE